MGHTEELSDLKPALSQDDAFAAVSLQAKPWSIVNATDAIT